MIDAVKYIDYTDSKGKKGGFIDFTNDIHETVLIKRRYIYVF